MPDRRSPIPAETTPARATLVAFAIVTAGGAAASVAIKFMLFELAPLWSAAIRFGPGALILWVAVVWARLPLPRGRALVGSLLYGILYFGFGFALIYTALTEVPAGTSQVVISLSPMAVVLLSALQRIERLRLLPLLGAVIAFLGTGVVFYESLGAASLKALGLVLGGMFCLAQSMVVVKRYPSVNPLVQNAIAQAAGAAILLVMSALDGEVRAIPREGATLAALAFLLLTGTVVFVMMVYVIETWTASAASYAMVLMPALTVPLAALMLGEQVSPLFVVGCAVIFVGLYVGLFRRGR